ncbi:MAG: type II toxin-antitoxin system RelE/ParE family toxin [bacterium]
MYEYIAKDSTLYAERMVDRLTSRSKQITDFPMSGRKVPEYDAEDIREVFEGHYRIIYRIRPKQIDILAVIHGSRLLPKDI